MKRTKFALQIMAVIVFTVVAAIGTWPRPAVDIRIPSSGVAEVHERFWRVKTLPETIFVAAGGRPRVRITNADSITHRLGLFSADAGETVEYSLPQKGTYTGECSAHPSSATLTFVVR